MGFLDEASPEELAYLETREGRPLSVHVCSNAMAWDAVLRCCPQDVDPADVFRRVQRADVCRVRVAAYELCRTEYRWGFVKIGKAFGRDHSSVQTALKRKRNEVRTAIRGVPRGNRTHGRAGAPNGTEGSTPKVLLSVPGSPRGSNPESHGTDEQGDPPIGS